MFFYYHPESDSLWKQAIPLAEDETDGLVEQITYSEHRELKLKQGNKMSNVTSFFDATGIPPEQGGAKHPVGKKFNATITNTQIVENADKNGAMFRVSFTTPAGSVDRNYNLWNKSQQAEEIAQKQLSALCHSVGILRVHMLKQDQSIDFENAGSELRNTRCQIDVDWQKDNEPTPEKPAGGYVEVSRVYDANGNEPGKAPANAPQPQQAVQQPQGQQGGWNSAPQGQPSNQQWQPGPSVAPGTPAPWGNR